MPTLKGIGRTEIPVHADDAGQWCAEEIEVAHHRGGMSGGVRDGDPHRAVNLRPKLIAVMLERLWQHGDVRRLVVGHSEQGVLQAIPQAIPGRSDGEHHPPRLDIGVRRRVLCEGEGFVDNLPGHRAGQELPCRMPVKDRSIEVRHRFSLQWPKHVFPSVGTTRARCAC